MLKEADFIEEWIEEGEARGAARGARTMLIHMLRRQFGSLTPDLEARLAELTPEQCIDLYDRAADAKDLSELGF